MDFPGLIADFAARHDVAGLAAEDGAAALANFRPASEAAAENTDLPAFGPDGFMQV